MDKINHYYHGASAARSRLWLLQRDISDRRCCFITISLIKHYPTLDNSWVFLETIYNFRDSIRSEEQKVGHYRLLWPWPWHFLQGEGPGHDFYYKMFGQCPRGRQRGDVLSVTISTIRMMPSESVTRELSWPRSSDSCLSPVTPDGPGYPGDDPAYLCSLLVPARGLRWWMSSKVTNYTQRDREAAERPIAI